MPVCIDEAFLAQDDFIVIADLSKKDAVVFANSGLFSALLTGHSWLSTF